MKKIILIFIVVIISALSKGVCATENNTALSDSGEIQQKTELELLKMKQSHELERANFDNQKIQTTLIPIVGIVFVFGVPAITLIIIILLSSRYKLKTQKARYLVIEKAIESGRELPDRFFEELESKKPASGKKRLSTALTLISLGISILFFGIITENKYVWSLSPIPLLIGLGQLLVYKLELRSEIEELTKKDRDIEDE